MMKYMNGFFFINQHSMYVNTYVCVIKFKDFSIQLNPVEEWLLPHIYKYAARTANECFEF